MLGLREAWLLHPGLLDAREPWDTGDRGLRRGKCRLLGR